MAIATPACAEGVMTKITVGIPAFRTKHLMAAVSSVLAQTFTDYELLVSDDSPDGSISAILRRLQDPRIRLIEGPRQGLAANSANIWEHTQTDLLQFLHDDDLLFPDALAELSALIANEPRFTIAASRRVIIDDYGRELSRPITYQTDDWMWFEPQQLAAHLVRTTTCALGGFSNMLIRRSAFGDSSCLSSIAGLPISHRIDAAFMLNAARRGPCAATGKFLSAARQHADQVTEREDAPDFSLTLLEWEACLRGAVALGLVPPQAALDGVTKLASLYRRRGGRFPEVVHFFQQLPALKEALGHRETDVLTHQFAADLAAVRLLVQQRAEAGADAPAPSQDAIPEPLRRIRAKVDHVSRRGARGWAWAPEAPAQRVRVEAILDDQVIGHTVADVPRADIAAWNIGATDYGFELRFYEPLLADTPPRFRFFVEDEWLEHERPLPTVEGARGERPKGAGAALLEHARYVAPGEAFEEFAGLRAVDQPRRKDGPDPLLVAFYLPQFHAIPENDRNWGTGFTEWRQLVKGVPRFPGHYQPRTPRDLGFYNLLDESVIRAQCEMALASGVGAFAFYYYWFNRRRVLERPVEIFLESDIQMPFFVIWANENWTRGWDGSEDHVLLKQDYNLDDEDALLADLARHMQDGRYLRLGGRPLFVIYNPDHIPTPDRTVARWRRKWSDNHGLEPLIFMAQTFDREDPRAYGFDGAMEFPPHKLAAKIRPREVIDAYSQTFAGRVMNYDDLVATSVAEPAPSFPLIKAALPSWDNEARRPNRSVIFEGSTPAKYEAWLQTLVERAIEHPTHGLPIVAINAWNEWAEGAYLEPDVYFGSAYLNATARALNNAIRVRNAALEKISPAKPAPQHEFRRARRRRRR